MNLNTKNNIPTVLVAFGATGDLMKKKIVPALYHLFRKNELPEKFRVVGFSRSAKTDAEFGAYVKEIIKTHLKGQVGDEKLLDAFATLFQYQQGTFEPLESYRTLQKTLAADDAKWGVCSNKLFYLAVPPEFYETIFNNLSASGLTKPCSPEEGWTRVIVEKPFGKDLKTAHDLDTLLSSLFKEEQIYRIDHYLAKEMLLNIMSFRFANNLFELAWGKELIQSIHIRVLEKIGAEDRGAFYDGVGALRDVGQNHLLQMLALVTMRQPANWSAEAVRGKRIEALSWLKTLSPDEVRAETFRAQYDGFRGILGVSPTSETETYFKVRAELNAPEWQGVPITMESGKRLGEPLKEIVITFKHPMPCLCPTPEHHKNEIIIRMEPKEEIQIEFWSKKPGLTMDTGKSMFQFLLREPSAKTQYTEEYEKLLLDCVRGDQTLFISTPEVRAMWQYIDPILDEWRKGSIPLKSYVPDTKDVLDAARYIDDAVPGNSQLKKEIGIIGLGKMGANLGRHLAEKGWTVHGYDRAGETVKTLEQEGIHLSSSLGDLVGKLTGPRVIWLMVPAGKAVDETLFGSEGVASKLSKGDIVIDGGNSFYKDSIVRAQKLVELGIHYLDAGVSGGPSGARSGASMMIGGDEATFHYLEPLFAALSLRGGYQFFPGAGAGHFVKMVHNGIEYGMMQSIAEGFAVMKKSDYRLDLTRVADIYNHGSVIESRLVGWLRSAFILHGEDLSGVSGSVGHTGEGAWTVKTAEEEKVKAKVIEEALNFRIRSEKNPDYTGQVVSALREQFGGHSVK